MDPPTHWLHEARTTLTRWRTAGSISTRITLSSLLLSVAVIAGAGTVMITLLYCALRDSIDNELDVDSRLLQQRFDTQLNTIARDLAALAASSHVAYGIADAGARDNYLLPMLREYVPPVLHVITLTVYDIKGMPLASNNRDGLGPLANTPAFRQALQSGQPQSTVHANQDGKQVLHLFYPVRPATGEHGMLVGAVALSQLFESATTLLGSGISHHELLPLQTPDGKAQWPARPDLLQRSWKASLDAPMDVPGMQLRIGRPKAEAFAALRRVAIVYGMIGAVVLLASLYFAHRMARRLASPISALNRIAGEIASSGSFDIQAEITGNRDMATLARSFNSMLERLRNSHAKLQLSTSEFVALAENSPDLIARFDRELRCIYINRMVHTYFHTPQEQVIGRQARELGIRRKVQQLMLGLLQNGGELIHEHAQDSRIYEARFVPEHGSDGTVASLLCIMRDVTARRVAEDALRLAKHAIESSDSAIMITSCEAPDYPIKYVNPAFERVTGYTAEEVIGRNCRFLQGDDRDQPELDLLRKAMQEQRDASALLRNYRKDGSRFWNELTIAPVRDTDGKVTHFIGEITDVTDEREQQEELHHQATHDALTGLPNRNLLTDRLMQAISYAQRYQRIISVAFLDLDKFKQINDTMGHDVGDQLLKIVAERLSGCVRDSDTVARLGGDEFVLVLYDQANDDITYHAMQRVLTSISQPMQLGGRDISVTCSIGFAVFPQDGHDAETLLKNADTAMYRAKELGRDNFQFYTEELNTRINERLAMEGGLRRALEQDEFMLYYQPRVDLGSGKMSGIEALIRWNHPALGLIEPRRFVPLAEELGLIHQIGEWVLRHACEQQASWQREGVADLPMSVNISAAQFLQKDFTQNIARVLRDSDVAPARLELEIKESLSMQDPETTIRVLRELRDMGVRMSIDDFGTGYSNLNFLKQFPVNTIKLDQSFVQDIVRNPEDLAMSDAVIAMAHSLHLKVTAEGVESLAQLALLADHGCDDMQGYYFSAALPVDHCTALLQENRPLPMDQLGRRQSIRTVLLVDDEPHVLSALERILRRSGCKILSARSAADAFDHMAMHEVGVILCDQRMPVMTGVEFFARIRHMYPSTVRMILSGYADIDAVTNAINVGAVYKFLNKPWDADELCTIVKDAFDKYENDLRHEPRATDRQAVVS